MIKKSISLIAVMLTISVAVMAQKHVVVEDYWWNDHPDGYLWSMGTFSTAEVNVAAMIPQDMEGCVIDEVAFYASDISQLTDIKLFVTRKLSKDINNLDIVLTPTELPTEADAQGKWRVRAKLPEDFIVPFGGAYIGYKVTPTDGMASAMNTWTDSPDGWPLPADKSMFIQGGPELQWSSLGDTFGAAAVTAHVKARNVEDNSVALYEKTEYVKLTGEKDFEYILPVKNRSAKDIQSLTYTVSIDGGEAKEFTYTFQYQFKAFGLSSIVGKIDAPDTDGCHSMDIDITKVDGVENTSDARSMKLMLVTVPKSAPRNTIVESFRSAGLGMMPLNIIGERKLKELYGGKAIILGANSDDYWECADYQEVVRKYYYNNLNNFCFDRALPAIDPYRGYHLYEKSGEMVYSTNEAFDYINAITSEATVGIDARWHSDEGTTIDVDVTTTFLYDREDAPYHLELYLKESPIQAVGKDDDNWWNEAISNAYSGSEEELPEEFDWFVQAVPIIPGYIFENVVRACWGALTGIDGSITAPIVKNVPQTYSTTLDLSEIDIRDKNNLHLVAMLVNEGGTVVNAAEVSLGNATSIESIKESTKAIVPDQIYNLRGIEMKTEKGIYIKGGKVRIKN